MPLFNKWQDELAEYGYANFWQVLNAKNYGVPQNRERVFLWSILRTEADPRPEYHFPRPFPLELRLKDMLEPKVDEKYYLSNTIIEGFEAHKKRMEERGNGFGFKPTDGGGYSESSPHYVRHSTR
jgi:DNA (cytosine-5)-methyltransferase 1